MVEFRKVFLLLAVLAITAGLVSAQQVNPLQCVANSGVPPLVRAEGIAEEVGQIIITCTGGVATAAGLPIPTINVQIFSNVNLTSRLLASTGTGMEATLLIDEPSPATQLLATATPPFVGTVVGLGAGVGYGGGAAGRPNVFLGNKAGENSIVWLNIPFDPPGTTPLANRVLRLANVRANANQAGVGLLTPTPLNMFISISGTGSLSLSNSQLTVAYVQKGLNFSATGGNFNQCEPGTYDFNLKFAERFATAFRRNVRTGETQPQPGTIYNTESMFYNPDMASMSGTAPTFAGLATQGTELIARFSNVPANVSITVDCIGTSPEGDIATLVSPAACLTGTQALTIAGGAASATWEVTSSNAGAISTISFAAHVTFKSSPLAGLGTATVTGNYAPTSTLFSAQWFDGTGPTAAPRFVDDPTSATTFTINSCRTNLLFPFVTTTAGWDTGIAISNTSLDPFDGTVPQHGTCTLFYYSGGAQAYTQTSTDIVGGDQLLFSVYGGNPAQNIQPITGFTGYMIAECNFQFAHGYAFVSDLGATRVAEGYLALIMDTKLDDIHYRTNNRAEILVH